MTALFGTKYFGFIASAYGITLVVILAMIIWIITTHRRRKSESARLEQAGFKRSAND